jgi:hypothetical protein
MRALAILAAAAMVFSLFLSWLNPAQTGGLGFIPWDLVRNLDPSAESLQRFVTQAPPELLAFLATFALAALFLVLAILGLPSRLVAFLAGGTAAGLVGYGVLQARDGLLNVGLPVPAGNDLQAMANQAAGLMGVGAWAWAGGAALLLLSALIGFGSRR